jgi:hypothetical protein
MINTSIRQGRKMTKPGERTRFAFISRETARPSHLRALTARKLGQRARCEQLNDIVRLVYTYIMITVT